jgi:hypothetical protein
VWKAESISPQVWGMQDLFPQAGFQRRNNRCHQVQLVKAGSSSCDEQQVTNTK